jgi:peptidoglycan/LPS O-acetylase OafA/YrhL
VEPFKLGLRPGLDGVRGLAILLVVLYHFSMETFGGGFIGVDLFFVLSGFLITTLLLEEWQETGSISLHAFYARRALRLLPVLIVVLLMMVVVSAMTETAPAASAMRTSALMTLFYSANWFLVYKAYPRGELSATWSLSVEEQFYIVWPVLLVLLLRMGASRRTIAAVVAVALLASAAARGILWVTTHSFERVMFGSDTHADGLLAGVLAALFLSWGGLPRLAGALSPLNGAALVVLGCMGIFVHYGWSGDAYMFLGGYVALNLGAVVLVVYLLVSPWAGLRRLFEFAPLVWIGRVSYGVYLWHFAAPWLLSRSGMAIGRGYWPAAVALTFAAAAASFYGLERPILKLKRRFERVPSRTLTPP